MHPDNFTEQQPEIGARIIYHDPKGREFNALVTVVYSKGCVNAVFVSGDESEQDSYGRQIKRTATCMHKSMVPAHGNYWRWPEEISTPFTPPILQ